MARAMELARRGCGAVEPNPMVGAVIVRGGQVLGEGWHRAFGRPHAEVEAIAAARQAGHDPVGTTMYVTLEPCCHYGKTGPCTRAVLDAGIARVVVGMEDPDANVAGKGLAQLRGAGVEVVTGVLAGEAKRLLAAYVTLRTLGRPWVICKWAQSLDGRIATFTGDSKWISGEASRRRVHELRGICDGVCVGAGTVRADDPLLTNRGGRGKQPARLVLDADLSISPACRLLAEPADSPVIVATPRPAPPAAADPLMKAGAEIMELPAAAGGIDLDALLAELGRRQWTRLLVEGGSGVLGSFLRAGLADELMVFVAPKLVGGPKSLGPVDWPDVASIEQALALPAPEVERIDGDVLLNYVLSEPGGQAPGPRDQIKKESR